MATVSSVSKNTDVGHQHIWYPSVPSPILPYLCLVYFCTSCTCNTHFSAIYNCLYLGFVRGRDYVHALTFSINIRARASVNAHTISRNVQTCAYAIFCACGARARTYTIFHARASVSILALTYLCMCVHVLSSDIIHAGASSNISTCGGCYPCQPVVLSNSA